MGRRHPCFSRLCGRALKSPFRRGSAKASTPSSRAGYGDRTRQSLPYQGSVSPLTPHRRELFRVVGRAGLEPATVRLKVSCSTIELTARVSPPTLECAQRVGCRLLKVRNSQVDSAGLEPSISPLSETRFPRRAYTLRDAHASPRLPHPSYLPKLVVMMMGRAGVEPATSRLRVSCSAS